MENINFGFWERFKAKRPFFVLAPMADVTDCAFREIIAASGKPDVVWTEFVSADGLASPKGREALSIDLVYGEGERPIVAQVFGGNPETVEQAAQLCRELGFDGVDINMGCPDRSIEKSKGGAYAIKDPILAKSVMMAARRGAGDMPVSIKTRLGYNKVDWDWVREVLSWQLPVVTFHLRTRKEMSLVPAHWDLMPEIIRLRDEIAPSTIVIGNGDVQSLDDAREKSRTYGNDGVMLGRAIFGNPWLFNEAKAPSAVPEKLEMMLRHTRRFSELLGEHKNFAIMKKHYKAYVNNFDGAKELRAELMDAPDYDTVLHITRRFLDGYSKEIVS